MKRLLCIFLLAALIICLFGGCNANEDNQNAKSKSSDVKSISFNLKEPIEIIENGDGYFDKDKYGNRYFVYTQADGGLYNVGNSVTVTTDKGSKEYMYIADDIDGYTWSDSNGMSLERNSEGFEFTYDLINEQTEHHWSFGDNYFTVSYKNVSTKVPFKIVKGNNVKSIEFKPKKPIVIDYDFGGKYHSEKFIYDYAESVDRIKITDNKGTYECSSYDIPVYSDNDRFVSCEYATEDEKHKFFVYFDDDQFFNLWEEGEHYFTLRCEGVETKVPVIVKKSGNRAKSISYKAFKPIYFVENSSGYYVDEEGEKYFKYDLNDPYLYFHTGAKIIIERESGKEEYTYVARESENEYGSYFADKNGIADDEYHFEEIFQAYADQEKNHWGLGKHEVTLSFGRLKTTVGVEVIKKDKAHLVE